MSSTPTPIPFKPNPTRFLPVAGTHICSWCQSVSHFRMRPDRCPFTGHDISNRFLNQPRQLIYGDHIDDGYPPGFVPNPMCFMSSTTVIGISTWIILCAMQECKGYEAWEIVKNEQPFAIDDE